MAKPIPTGRDLSNPRSFQSNRSVDLSKVPGAVAAAARAAAQGYGAARGGIGAALGSTASAASRPFSVGDAERFGPYVPNLQSAGMPAGSTVSIPGSPSRGRVDNAIKQIAADLAANEFGANRRSRGTVNPFESATSGAGAGVRPSTDYSAADIGSLGALVQATGNSPRFDPQTGIAAALTRATQPQGGLGALEGETAARQRRAAPAESGPPRPRQIPSSRDGRRRSGHRPRPAPAQRVVLARPAVLARHERRHRGACGNLGPAKRRHHPPRGA